MQIFQKERERGAGRQAARQTNRHWKRERVNMYETHAYTHVISGNNAHERTNRFNVR